mgnify:CR=1 FL=1
MAGKINLTDQLKQYFGFDKFKGNQEAIIQNLLDGRDTFVLMPTGGGKSLCYQLPSLLMEGTGIVISPLIALMKNQVDAMRNFSEEDGIAHFINSSLNKGAIDQVKADILAGKTKLLYVAPESLTKEENVEFLRSVKISFYAVDEAHCISEWGHDFRPEYRRIRPIINEIGKAPLIALTATATPKVQHDIQKNLGMVDAQIFKSSFNRPNLYYEVRPKTANIDRDIIKFIRNNPEKSGIIYCLSRKKVEELAEILQANGINARAYHAGMDSATRTQNQDDFLMEKIDVIVATIAFGMGIDKGDVRYVLHYNMPASMEAYYQEAGRAGRDGDKSECVLFYSPQDVRVQQFLIDQDNENEELTEEEQKIVKERQREKLKEMTFYATTDDCLRAYMLRYFGEKAKGKCDNCSNCKGEYDTYDVTRIARSVIRCINDLDERYGTTAICEVLTGLETDRVIRNGLDDEISFGLLYDVEISEIRNVINYLIREEYITQTDGKYPILTLNHKAREFMKKDVKVNVKVRKKNTVKPKFVREKTADSNLFELLRQCRMKIAQQKRVPAFMIFTDASLRDMTVKQPTTEKEFLTVSGVGSAKMKAYGKEFMNVIKQYKKR